jgi:hypothetical protein
VTVATTLAVGSVLLGALWWPDRADALDRCDRGDLPGCINRRLLERQRNAVIGVTATAATGGIALGAAGAALLGSDRGEPGERAVRCGPLLGGLRCQGRF